MTPKQELLQELETTPLPIILQLLQFLRFLKAQKPPLDFIDFADTAADMDNQIDLLKRIVRVSLETLKIVNELPPLEER